jgi:hypothetical protein
MRKSGKQSSPLELVQSADWRQRTQGWKELEQVFIANALPEESLRRLRGAFKSSLVEERSSLMGAAYRALLALAVSFAGTAALSALLSSLAETLVETTGRGNSFVSRTASEALGSLLVVAAGDARLVEKIARFGVGDRNKKIRIATAGALRRAAAEWPAASLIKVAALEPLRNALLTLSRDKDAKVKSAARGGLAELRSERLTLASTAGSPMRGFTSARAIAVSPAFARASVRRASLLAAARRQLQQEEVLPTQQAPPPPPPVRSAARPIATLQQRSGARTSPARLARSAPSPSASRLNPATLGRELVRRASADVSVGGAGAVHIARALVQTVQSTTVAAEDNALAGELGRALIMLPPTLAVALRVNVRRAIADSQRDHAEYSSLLG